MKLFVFRVIYRRTVEAMTSVFPTCGSKLKGKKIYFKPFFRPPAKLMFSVVGVCQSAKGGRDPGLTPPQTS